MSSSILPSTTESGRRVYVSRLARKRIEAGRVRQQLAEQKHQQLLRDQRNQRSNRVPMPRPGSVKERVEGGLTYTLLDWMTGRKVGRLAAEEAACALSI